jgi:hypothetical protein
LVLRLVHTSRNANRSSSGSSTGNGSRSSSSSDRRDRRDSNDTNGSIASADHYLLLIVLLNHCWASPGLGHKA